VGAVQQAFAQAFMDGFHIALIVGGSVLLLAAIVANRFIPGRASDLPTEVPAERVPVEI